MAVIAGVGAIDMRRVLTRRCGAVMAARTSTRDIGVIKVNTGPVIGGVAILASIATGNMSGRLACGNAAVVTA